MHDKNRNRTYLTSLNDQITPVRLIAVAKLMGGMGKYSFPTDNTTPPVRSQVSARGSII